MLGKRFLAFLCLSLPFSGCGHSDTTSSAPVPEDLISSLGLRMISPLEGEWVHEQACKSVVEVWAPNVGIKWEDYVQVTISWQGAAAYIPVPLKDWEVHSFDPSWSAHPVPAEVPARTQEVARAEAIVQLMPSSEMWSNQRSNQMSLLVSASLMRLNCTQGCEIFRVSAPFTLLRTWGEALSEVNENPTLAGSLMGRSVSAGRAWPPAGIVLQSPGEGDCVEGPTVSVGFSFVGAHYSDDSIEVVVNGSPAARTGVWEREVDIFAHAVGRVCVAMRHMDRDGVEVIGTAAVSVCFNVGNAIGDGSKLDCDDTQSAQSSPEAPGVLMVTWMPPVHHVTGMSERLWQVAEKLLRAGRRVEVASVMCSHNKRDERAGLHPQIRMIACGQELQLPSVIDRIVLTSTASHVIVASWWFGHPSPRSQPEMWLPALRDFRPHTPVMILVDDLFVPFPYPYNATVPPDQTSLLAVCGAQTIALAAADAVGTLTQEDADQLRSLLPRVPMQIGRVRYSLSASEMPPAPAPYSDRLPFKRMLYTGSCHAANEAALRWLLEEAMPLVSEELIVKGNDPREWKLSIVGNITPQTCAPSLCRGGVCEQTYSGGVQIRFEGYVESLDQMMQESLAFIAPRLAGLGLSTKLMLGLEQGLPTVTTPHGTTGYNISDWGGNQGVLVADHTEPSAFAAAIATLVSTESLWQIASEGGRQHVYSQFRPEQQQHDIERLLEAAEQHRRRAMEL